MTTGNRVTYSPQQIVAIGGRDWQGRRTYINDVAPLIGVDVSTYKTGNISGATLDGQPISHAEAGRLLAVKVYLDHTTGRLMIVRDRFAAAPRSLSERELSDRIAESVARMVATAVSA